MTQEQWMELRYDACGNESRDRNYWRWEFLSAEMIHNVRALTAWRTIQERNVKCLDAHSDSPTSGGESEKTRHSSRDSIYCPANCRALSSNNGSFSRSATRLMALCSFAITSPKIVCCNFCKGLFLKAGWRWVDRNTGMERMG